MEVVFAVILIVLGLIIGILNIILFFKIWGMTNNIAEMLTYTKSIQKNVFDICVIAENNFQSEANKSEVKAEG